MNSAHSQDTKLIYRNLLLFYTLIMNYVKEKSKKYPIENYIKKNEIPMNKLNQSGERPIL